MTDRRQEGVRRASKNSSRVRSGLVLSIVRRGELVATTSARQQGAALFFGWPMSSEDGRVAINTFACARQDFEAE